MKKIKKDNNVVGYYINKEILFDDKVVGNVVQNKIYLDGLEIGYIKDREVYINSIYIGTIQRNFIILYFIIILIVMLLSLSLSYYLIGNRQGVKEIEISRVEGFIEISDNIDILDNTNPGKDKDNKKLIAPGSKEKKIFEVKNSSSEKITYKIQFSDSDSDDKLPIKYRIKVNNKYIFGNDDSWLTLNKYELSSIVLDKNSSSIFQVEWYWDEKVDSVFDTALGIDGKSSYKINIKILDVKGVEE